MGAIGKDMSRSGATGRKAKATDVVNAIQKCHRLGKAEVSPEALRVARLSSPETSYIVGLVSLAKVNGKAGVFLFW